MKAFGVFDETGGSVELQEGDVFRGIDFAVAVLVGFDQGVVTFFGIDE